MISANFASHVKGLVNYKCSQNVQVKRKLFEISLQLLSRAKEEINKT